MKHFTKYPKSKINASRRITCEEDYEEEYEAWTYPGVSYVVYELEYDPDIDDYEELDGIDGFDTLDEAIEFAKSQDFPTHIVFVPSVDPDDDPDYADFLQNNYEYEPYEVVWESWT